MSKKLARLTNHRSVNDGHNLFHIVNDCSVEKGFIPILQSHHVDVFLQVICFVVKVLENPLALFFPGKYPGWEEPS